MEIMEQLTLPDFIPIFAKDFFFFWCCLKGKITAEKDPSSVISLHVAFWVAAADAEWGNIAAEKRVWLLKTFYLTNDCALKMWKQTQPSLQGPVPVLQFWGTHTHIHTRTQSSSHIHRFPWSCVWRSMCAPRERRCMRVCNLATLIQTAPK